MLPTPQPDCLSLLPSPCLCCLFVETKVLLVKGGVGGRACLVVLGLRLRIPFHRQTDSASDAETATVSECAYDVAYDGGNRSNQALIDSIRFDPTTHRQPGRSNEQ